MDVHTNKYYSEMIENNCISKELLLECYSKLDEKVSKYAYLKKKYANSGRSNECYTQDFTSEIKKRNVIAKALKLIYDYSDEQIKNEIQKFDTVITGTNCSKVVEMIKNENYCLTDG